MGSFRVLSMLYSGMGCEMVVLVVVNRYMEKNAVTLKIQDR